MVYVGVDLMGDAIMKLPFVYSLRAAFPDARITWVAGKGPSQFAAGLAPLVTGLLDEVIEHAGFGSHAGELLGPRPLPGRHFQLIIDTQRRVLTTLIVRRIRHDRFVSAAAGYLLSNARPCDRTKRPSLAGQLCALTEAASGRPAITTGALPSDPVTEGQADALLPPGPCYVGFAPGAGLPGKRWPLDHFLAVAAGQRAAGRRPVFFLGPDEAAWSEAVRTALPAALLPLQDAGAITPLLTIALARRLAAAVANDCGAGHLLAAGRAPLVSLFGPTAPDKFAPAAERLIILRAESWGGNTMERIPVAAVTAALASLLGQAGPREIICPPSTTMDCPVR